LDFALPLFAHPVDSSMYMIQVIDELTGTVSGFKAFKPEEGVTPTPVTGAVVQVGDSPVYAFIAGADVHAGNLNTLSPVLSSFAKEHPEKKSLILQISELIGTDQEKKVARLGMRTLLMEKQGAAAAHSFYEGSVLRSALWRRLLAAATDSAMAQRILSIRARLSAKVTDTGTVQLDLMALPREDRTAIDETNIISEILQEFDPRPIDLPRVAPNRDTSRLEARQLQENVDALVHQISRTGRQEERIAILLSAILENPPVGRGALLEYQRDRAKMADWALAELRRLFTQGDFDSIHDEQLVAAVIPKLFTQQYPMTRGDLLYALARHLGKWPQVNQAIRRSLEKTHSMYVMLWKKEIEHALNETRTQVL
jgi:hypothetical protein